MSEFARDKPAAPATAELLSGAGKLAQLPAWSEVTKLTDQTFRVRLGGSFGQGWLASLCCGLAAQRINIERAHAMRTRNHAWIAEFTARALPGAPDPESVPYLALAVSPGVPACLALGMDQYSLEACYDGTLKLALEAQDTLGLLGGLLDKLAALGLYPVEMHVDTQTARASDTLWLSTADGGTPGDATRAGLERMLNAAVRTPRA